MFALAILVGIYSYIIFSLGILGILYKGSVILVTILFFLSSILYFKINPEDFPKLNLKNKKIRSLLFIFVVMMIVNFIGVLGPELSFDALWYHLTIPKIFLENQSIFYIPGGLFYYSVMPKLTEMLYIGGLSFGSEIIPKLIHFSFGIFTSIVIYKISRKYLDEKLSFLAVLIFYGNLVVAWESITAYVDLSRAFFESMTVWGFLNYFEKKDRKWLAESGIMLGLAVSSKPIALVSISIFIILLFIFEKNKSNASKNSVLFILFSLLIPFAWFFMSFLETGTPFYPFFSPHFELLQSNLFGLSLINPLHLFQTFLNQFLFSKDSISPIYIIIFPLLFIIYKKLNIESKILYVYSALALFTWYLFASVEGSRFILPYLPIFSVISMIAISKLGDIRLRRYLSLLIVFIFIMTISYRVIVNAKFIPVVLGVQSKDEFLTKNLNFDFADFYDTDGFFRENITEADMVLLYGFHNLYYADFPFIHESYVKKGDRFNYVATQNADLPERFSHWEIIYQNNDTHVSVYKYGGMKWSY